MDYVIEASPKKHKWRKNFNNGATTVATSTNDILLSKEERRRRGRRREAARQYGRGSKVPLHNIKDVKLRRKLGETEEKIQDATIKAKDAELLHETQAGFLEAEDGLERTYKVTQEEIQASVAISTSKKKFDLKLDQLGPYICEYTRNGRDLLIAGRKGHVAAIEWRTAKLRCEIQLNETIRDILWLHNNQFFAVAQKEYVYVYDSQGVEIHSLRQHKHVTHMEFLPYHFLLGTMSSGWLRYLDTSTGQSVAEHLTKLGPTTSATQNPYNAIIHMGHQEGTVTLWSPNMKTPLVKLLCHRGPVRSLAVDREGRYMITGGQDQRMAIWDIRMFKEVQGYPTRKPLTSISISDRGLTATAWGTKSTIWKGLFQKDVAEQVHVAMPYMEWGGEGKYIDRLQWCPLDDVLGIGHDEGFSSIIVPGAGEPNFDALESNPFETKTQRREGEVKSLLNKLQPEMIALDPNFIGKLDVRSHEQRLLDKYHDDNQQVPEAVMEIRLKNKAKGKNTTLKRYMRKQAMKRMNIIDEKRKSVEAEWEKVQQRRKDAQQKNETELGPALSRFARMD